MNERKIKIFGHRGAPKYEQENTINSFVKAIQQKVDGIELDVQLTKDNHIVINHDKKLSDEKTIIKKVTKKEIKAICVKEKRKINFLDDIIQIIKDIKILNIEIKSGEIFNNRIEKKIVKFIEKNKIQDKTIVSSFNPIVLIKIKKINKKIKTGYLYSKKDVPILAKTYIWAKIIKIDTIHPDINYVNYKMVKWAKKNNIKIYTFTVNTLQEIKKAIKLKVDGIFTDDPLKTKKTIKEKQNAW